jgi:nitrile hydratase accessory protein
LSGSNRLEPLADELRPAFNEPWQAEAYALVQVLIETGRISSSQWAKAFGAALWEAAGQGEPDSSDTYYSTLSETLQRVLVRGGQRQDDHQRVAEVLIVHETLPLLRMGLATPRKS